MATANVYFTDFRALYLNAGAYQGSTSFQAGEDNTFSETFRPMLKPDFASSSIPAGSTFNSVTFFFTLEQAGNFRSSNNRALRFYRLRRAYTTAATWQKYDGTNNWGSLGAANTTTDRESTQIGAITMLTSWADESTHSFTLDATAIEEMFNGTFTNNGIIGQVDTENADRQFFHTTTPGKEPYMSIDYTEPVGGNKVFMMI